MKKMSLQVAPKDGFCSRLSNTFRHTVVGVPVEELLRRYRRCVEPGCYSDAARQGTGQLREMGEKPHGGPAGENPAGPQGGRSPRWGRQHLPSRTFFT